MFLLRQTRIIPHRRKNGNSLHQLVKTQLNMIIDHTIIADAAFIHIRIFFVIWNIVPQRFRVLWLKHPDIYAGIVRSRGEIFLSFAMLYEYHHTDKCQQILFQVFIFTHHLFIGDSTCTYTRTYAYYLCIWKTKTDDYNNSHPS